MRKRECVFAYWAGLYMLNRSDIPGPQNTDNKEMMEEDYGQT